MCIKYKLVYRVESRSKGIGPYKSVGRAMTSELPEPDKDMTFPVLDYYRMDREHLFGAPTKSAMREWINEPLILRSHCYVVRKYKVPVDKVVASQIQCIFKKKDAQCVAEYDIVEFCKTKKG